MGVVGGRELRTGVGMILGAPEQQVGEHHERHCQRQPPGEAPGGDRTLLGSHGTEHPQIRSADQLVHTHTWLSLYEV